MHIDEIRETLAEMAADQATPVRGTVAVVVGRARRRLLWRRLSVTVALLAVVGVAAGFALNRNGARRGVEVGPTPKPAISSPATPGPVTQTRVVDASRIVFTSAKEGWICADPVLHTADGGHTWQAASWEPAVVATQSGFQPSSARLTCAAVPTDAYVVVQSAGRAALVVPVQGGSDPTGPVVLPAFPADDVVTQVVFVDRDHGWILASAPHGAVGQGLLYRTTTATGPFDPTLVSSAAPVGGVAFADARRGWGIAGARVEQTTDGGATWHTVAVPTPQPLAPALGVVLEQVVVHGTTIVIEGNIPSGTSSRTFFLVSADGGSRWTERSGPPATVGTTETTLFDAIDAEHWRFAFGTAIWVTDDGGGTWITREIPAGSVSIAFTDARTGWATDGSGHVSRTLDGARTWHRLSTVVQTGYDGLAAIPTGCPTRPVSAPPSGRGADDASATARAFLLHARGWTGEQVAAVYPVDKPAGQYGVVFSTNVPKYCGAAVASASYGVEVANPSITQDNSRYTALVVGHFADGWKVWGFYR